MTDSAQLNGRGGAALNARVQAIELELVQQRGQLITHEQGCDMRQTAIIEALGKINGTLTDQAKKVGDLVEAATLAKGRAEGAATARKPKWWMDPVLAAVLSAMLMGAGGLVNHLLEGSRAPQPSPVTPSLPRSTEMPESRASREADEAAARGELTQAQKDDQAVDRAEQAVADAEAEERSGD